MLRSAVVARSRRALLSALLASASLLALTATPAHAGLLVSTATGCQTQQLSQPFQQFGDASNYTSVSNGGLEAGSTDWTLSKASVTSGNETYYVRSTKDSKSLNLPGGSSATTRAICVGVDHPYMRFFAKSSGTSLLSSLRVDVLFESSLGVVLSLPIGTISPHAAWAPSPRLLLVANLLPLLPGSQTPVAFRFTPQGSGSWGVDDVYVDPHRTS